MTVVMNSQNYPAATDDWSSFGSNVVGSGYETDMAVSIKYLSGLSTDSYSTTEHKVHCLLLTGLLLEIVLMFNLETVLKLAAMHQGRGGGARNQNR